jgi:cell division protein YceG involved in septum cleavage
MKKLNKKIFYILIAFIAFGIIGLSTTLINYSSTPINNNDHKDAVVHVYILKDSSFLEATKMLKQAGLVNNSFLFCSLSMVKISYRHIRAGEYKFSTSMTPSEMIDELNTVVEPLQALKK